MTAPVVSVITATRNRPALLRQALLSIAQQTYADFEVIVVDDGSSQETRDQYTGLWSELDERFTLHFRSPVDGPGSDPGTGRNFGARLARGQLIAFLDHDDFWERSDHLAVGVKALSDNEADYYFTHVRLEPPYPTLLGWTPPEQLANCPRLAGEPVVQRVPIEDFVRVMQHYHIHPSHSMVRRELFQSTGGFLQGLKTFDDVNLMFRIADQARSILYRPAPAVAIRLPEGKSFSLASSPLQQTLAAHHAMMDARVRCQHPLIRRCARARVAWTLRELSQQTAPISRKEACLLAWEAVVTFPTLGALWFLTKTMAGATLGRPRIVESAA